VVVESLLALLFSVSAAPSRPLPPAWSPDHSILATTRVDERFVPPPGAGYCLVLNSRPVYPSQCAKHRYRPTYTGIHTFLSDLAWSPDSCKVAFVEKIYDWEYIDPWNQYFDGAITHQKFFLAVVSKDGTTVGYALDGLPQQMQPRWDDSNRVTLNGRTYDLRSDLPKAIR
jgi:hypothetical protein